MVGRRHRRDPAALLHSQLDRKLARDMWAMKLQALAIALVVAGGIAVMIVSAGLLDSLQMTRAAYYERYRFADVWAPVVRAPDQLVDEVRDLPGVSAAEARIRLPVLFDMPSMDAPAAGEAISLPDGRQSAVNRLHLAEGRLPRPGHRDEAVLLDSFAEAHGLQLGDTVQTTIHGGRENLRIVGRALSPEHVYAIAPGQIVPDARLFGVVWMGRQALGELVDRDGAFNEIVAVLEAGQPVRPALARLDGLLAPYGAAGAYGRDQQFSNAFVSSEIDQLDTMATIIPPVFLVIAAFLVNVVLSRLIATERTEIGLLKAFGYSDRAVVLHYLKFAGIIGLSGLLVGIGMGSWFGSWMAEIYTRYLNFPFLIFELNPGAYSAALLITLVTVGSAGGLAAWRAARLAPAVAMRPSPPPDFSGLAGASLARWRLLDHQTRMIVRQISRWPGRSGFTLVGIATSGGLLIGTLFFLDSMEAMVDVYFGQSNRQDIAVTFVEPRSLAAVHTLDRLPGVLRAEPVRQVAVRLRHETTEERTALTGTPRDALLTRMIDRRGQPVEPPPGALVLSRDLADALGVDTGERVTIEVTEGGRPVLELPVAAVATTLIGSAALMEIGDLNGVMREGAMANGANLLVDPDATSPLYTRLKQMPGIAGISLQREAERSFVTLMDQNMGTAIFIYSGFAALIAIGVIYNSVRISFSEREHELAVLRVLGFTRAEVAYVLLGEIGLITLAALPAGAITGVGLAWYFAGAMSSDLFRLPFVIHPGTFGLAAIVVLAAAISSSLLVRARLDQLDLVAALKAGE
ncbi:ABC transporter permease [Maricaulis sp. CAU 1757]